MDWEDEPAPEEEQQVQVEVEAIVLNHHAPSQHTAGQQKGKREVLSATELEERALTLEAWAPLYAGEPEALRLARERAGCEVWAHLSGAIRDTLEGGDARVFDDLLRFARTHHPGSAAEQQATDCTDAGGDGGSDAEDAEHGAAGAPLEGEASEPEEDEDADACAAGGGSDYALVPTGLVLAGGVNSADHAATFPNLAAHLRAGGCYAALLSPASFGRSPNEALNAMLCQLAGLESRAGDWAALAAWYADETGGGGAAIAAEAEAAAAAAALEQQQQEQQQEQRGPEGRRLRERRAQSATSAVCERQRANRRRPVVVVVESTEGVDVTCLRDVIRTISLGRQEVPITLMLGLTTAAGALEEMLPSEVTDRCLATRQFRLATAIARLESLVGEVLLGGCGRWPGLVFGPGVAQALYDSFCSHYFAAGHYVEGLKQAALDHFLSSPASFLALPALEGEQALAAALAELPKNAAAAVRTAVEGRGPAGQAAAVASAMAGWSRWALALHWLATAARACGLPAQLWRYRELYRDALSAKFMQGPASEGRRALALLQAALAKLGGAEVRALAGRLRGAAERVWGAGEAAAEELERLREFEAIATPAAGDGALERGQLQHQHQQAEAAEGEQGPEAAAAAAGRRQREVYYSRASRKQALESAAAAASKRKGRGGPAAAAPEHVAHAPATPGARLAGWLVPLLQRALATPPHRLPGAAVFSCTNATALRCLSGRPREALHAALTESHLYLEAGTAAAAAVPQLGLSAELDDACLAYRLLDQDPNCVNVADWFVAFRDVHQQAREAATRADGVAAAGTRAKQKPRRRKVKAAAGKGKGGGEREQQRREEEEAEAAWQREVAARFMQATSELQFVGLVRPAKRRRRGAYVQRLVHMPALGAA